MQRLQGRRIKGALIAGISWFKHFKDQIDRINVFPVPDGDTGKNMNNAMQAALKEIKQIKSNNASDVVWAAARGALMGGRGCSGMILSGFFTGFAEGVGERSSLLAEDLARAFQVGCLRARERIDHPKEGTILSVGEAAAKTALKKSKKSSQLNDIILSAWEGARRALARTPKQLPVLKENNVVDAGGMGLVFFLEGMVRFIKRQPLNKPSDVNEIIQPSIGKSKGSMVISEYKFCTEFIIHAPDSSLHSLKQHLEPLGQDIMVAPGEEGIFKVHIHAKDPKLLLESVARLGMITWKKVDDMEKEHLHQFQQNN